MPLFFFFFFFKPRFLKQWMKFIAEKSCFQYILHVKGRNDIQVWQSWCRELPTDIFLGGLSLVAVITCGSCTDIIVAMCAESSCQEGVVQLCIILWQRSCVGAVTYEKIHEGLSSRSLFLMSFVSLLAVKSSKWCQGIVFGLSLFIFLGNIAYIYLHLISFFFSQFVRVKR